MNKITLFLKDSYESLKYLIAPYTCDSCGNILSDEEKNICFSCLSSLLRTDFENLRGNPMEQSLNRLVSKKCKAFCLYSYSEDKVCSQIVHSFKYNSKSDLAFKMGEIMGKVLKGSGLSENYDILIPIPLHEKRLKKRGYNQAEILCRGVSSTTNLPVFTDCLVRTENTITQTHKNKQARFLNTEHIFELKNIEKLESKRILLIDDVFTTGATMSSALNILEHSKCSYADVFTLSASLK